MQPILSPDTSNFRKCWMKMRRHLNQYPGRLAREMYRFRAPAVPFGDKELAWQTG